MNGINYATVIELWSEKHNGNVECCSHYGEPGYSDPERGIVFANWNDVPKRISEGLERQGYSIEWCDEWYIDTNNDKAYRTQADSYGWQSRLMYSESAGDYLTPDDGIESWVQECENNERMALPSWWPEADIAALGWVKQTDIYESGFHPGQNDKPADIAKRLIAARNEFLFQIDHVQQFDMRFHVWVKAPELFWFTSSSGHIELQLTMEQANSGSHQGQCDADVLALSKMPDVACQLERIDPALLVAELEGYGAWDAAQLADHEENLQRILWLACGDITEESKNRV